MWSDTFIWFESTKFSVFTSELKIQGIILFSLGLVTSFHSKPTILISVEQCCLENTYHKDRGSNFKPKIKLI